MSDENEASNPKDTMWHPTTDDQGKDQKTLAGGESSDSPPTIASSGHIRNKHYDKLSEQEKKDTCKKGEILCRNGHGDCLPARSLQRTLKEDLPLSRLRCQIQDRFLGKYLVAALTSFTMLDIETKAHIASLVYKCKKIALTVDAWTSLNQKSYITLTAHVIDDKWQIQTYCLETSELQDRHKSEINLICIT